MTVGATHRAIPYASPRHTEPLRQKKGELDLTDILFYLGAMYCAPTNLSSVPQEGWNVEIVFVDQGLGRG